MERYGKPAALAEDAASSLGFFQDDQKRQPVLLRKRFLAARKNCVLTKAGLFLYKDKYI